MSFQLQKGSHFRRVFGGERGRVVGWGVLRRVVCFAVSHLLHFVRPESYEALVLGIDAGVCRENTSLLVDGSAEVTLPQSVQALAVQSVRQSV